MGETVRGVSRSGVRTVGAAAAIALVLSGCASSADSTADTSASPSGLTAPSASPSASQAPQPKPSQTLTKRQQLIADAEAALLRWQEVGSRAFSGNRTAEKKLMRLETPTHWSERTVPLLNEDGRLNRVQRGEPVLENVQVEEVTIRKDETSIRFRACQDLSDMRLVTASGPNKNKIVFNPNTAKNSYGPRFEILVTITRGNIDRWRVTETSVPLRNGKAVSC